MPGIFLKPTFLVRPASPGIAPPRLARRTSNAEVRCVTSNSRATSNIASPQAPQRTWQEYDLVRWTPPRGVMNDLFGVTTFMPRSLPPRHGYASRAEFVASTANAGALLAKHWGSPELHTFDEEQLRLLWLNPRQDAGYPPSKHLRAAAGRGASPGQKVLASPEFCASGTSRNVP